MQTFGLDIGSSIVKLVQISREGGKVKLLTAAAAETPVPGMRSESVADLNKVSEVIKRLVSDARVTTNQVVCVLPESGVHVEVVEMPPMSEGELASAIIWEAEQVIPFQISESEVSWQVISDPSKAKTNRQQVLIAATSKRMVEKYSVVLDEARLFPQAMEPSCIAMSRSLGKFSSGVGMVVGLGASGTDIAVVVNSYVIVSRSIPTGGDAITRTLASYLNLEYSQAEEYKRAYGLTENQLEGKVRQAMIPVVDVILSEMKKVIEFYQSKDNVRKISSVVLTGGGAGLPDLVPYLASGLGFEVVIGEAFADVIRDERMTRVLSGYGPLYGVAMGLALREVEG
jgi:type IV pilus assembly protein PilM